MAGDWIKMRADLQTHPKVVRISSALKADRLRVVGGLHAVWCLFDAHSEDGNLSGYTPFAVDELIGFSGFADAMCAVKWLSVEPEGLSLPEFDEHNGQSAKRRATESKRKRLEREGLEQSVRNLSASDADKKRAREEKRREEIEEKKKSAPRPATTLEGVSPELLADYLKVRTAKRAGPLTETAINGLRRESAKASLTLEQAITACVEFGWQGFNASWYAERTAAKPGHGAMATTSSDPDSRSAIEAEGVAKGIGKWNEISEQWHLYKARVRGNPRAGMTLDALAGMAAQRQGAH